MQKNKMTGSPGSEKNSVLYAKLMLFGLLLVNLFGCLSVYATDKGIFDALDNNTKTLIDRAVVTFDTSITPIVLFILLVTIGIAGTNVKVAEVAKSAIKWVVIIFVAINCLSLIVNTFKWIAGVINGDTGGTEGASIQSTYQAIETIKNGISVLRI